MQLGLGTVQFGMRYGVAHRGERAPRAELAAVLELAREAGLRVLDTAPRYGDAERRLGELGSLLDGLDLVTKTVEYPPGASGEERARCMQRGFRSSLAALGRERVHGLLEHVPGRWLEPGGEALHAALVSEREAGRAARIGFSALDLGQVDELLERYDVDLVQLPLSAVDQRAWRGGLLTRLAERGIEVHVRSALLQGALAGDPARVDVTPGLSRAVRAFRRAARGLGLEPLEAALGFALSVPGPAAVVVGAQDASQLRQLLAAARTRLDPLELAAAACEDEDVVDPFRWKVAR